MLDLLTVTFRDLLGVAIAIAVANAIVLIAALVCVFVLHRLDKEEAEEKKRPTSTWLPK